MPVQVIETPIAATQAAGLRGHAKRAYDAFLDDLAARGCAALAYRLTGPDPLPRLCVKHLRAQDRVVVAFTEKHEAWVLLVAPHLDDDPGRNVYDLLYTLAGVQPEDQAQRTKPPCCDTDTNDAPSIATDDILGLTANARRLTSSHRRGQHAHRR
jgi:hypothetical protein